VFAASSRSVLCPASEPAILSFIRCKVQVVSAIWNTNTERHVDLHVSLFRNVSLFTEHWIWKNERGLWWVVPVSAVRSLLRPSMFDIIELNVLSNE
jgi:hypothetical protein